MKIFFSIRETYFLENAERIKIFFKKIIFKVGITLPQTHRTLLKN